MILKKEGLANRLRKLIFQGSHLAPYLALTSETVNQKRIRLFDDQSYIHEQEVMERGNSNFFQRILFSKKATFYPCSTRLLVWYAIVFISIMYIFIEMGLVITYGEIALQSLKNNVGAILFQIFALFVLIGDMFVQCNTGFLRQGMVVAERPRIIRRYLTYFLLPDFLTILFFFLSLVSHNYNVNYLKLIVVLKFIRISQIDNFYLRRLSIHRFRKTLYILCKQMVIIFILSHVIGLWYYLIDYSLLQSKVCAGDNSDFCWLQSSVAWSPIIELDWHLQYFYSLYWGVSTISTISYGDIASNNPQQTIYAIFMMCFGFIVYAYITNNIIQVILWARGPSDHLRAENILMEGYMKTLKIDLSIQVQVKEYLKFIYIEQKNRNLELEDQMKAKLPDDLRFELVRSAYGKFNDGLKVILDGGNEVTRLLYFIQEKKFTGNQIVVAQDSLIDRICYLHKGEIRLSCSFGAQDHIISKLTTIDEFVLLYDYFTSQKSRLSVIAEKGSIFYFILSDKIEAELLKSSYLRELFKYAKYEIFINQKFSKIFYMCYYCQKNHHWYLCEEHFPSFTQVSLSNPASKEVKLRTIPRQHRTLRDRSNLRQLEMLKMLRSNQVYSKIQKRLGIIREKMVESKVLFDVDIAYDWKVYLPNWNLSALRQVWNKKKDQRRLSANINLFANLF